MQAGVFEQKVGGLDAYFRSNDAQINLISSDEQVGGQVGGQEMPAR